MKHTAKKLITILFLTHFSLLAQTDYYLDKMLPLLQDVEQITESKVNKIQELIRSNGNLNAQDAEGNTVLLLAARGGHLEIAQTLIDAGADVNLPNEHGNTALLLAASRRDPLRLINLLIDAGADVNHPNEGGNTALTLGSIAWGHLEVTFEL